MGGEEFLFPASVIPADLTASMPSGYIIRPLARSDSTKAFFQCLEGLTWCGDVSDAEFAERFDEMAAAKGTYYFVVIEHAGVIVGTGALILEIKLIHNRCKVGHIEEICISGDHQKLGLGLKMLDALNGIAVALGCEKTVLNCGPKNEAFYVKCGFHSSGMEMSRVFLDQ
ncbi:acyl-CoA N-acyltransferase [Microdochium trichocladiopsis]|uniref:Glucosamine 6-phosphate N-acetyltransferase n=1 Tax=Microdochium trichocladiopsis TaxID=1682393 RepID=A0A9P8Y285_9PEZI|nr:acyl-CoA N-acyltransferase [Microdochium trichocladiopsis]KAH7027781.1 acyl-CoA N-acyltransferase [Microdochium trichocladiopsis]